MQVAKEEKLRNRVIIRGQQVEGKMGERILWSKVNFSITSGDKIGITGANGSGKTTFLLKILNQKDGITVSPAVTFGYFSQMLEVLNTKDSVMENMKASSVQNETIMRTVLARLGFIGEEVFKPVHVLSGGERVKAALAKLFVSSANVLVLDEPTNFLDITAVEALEALLIDYSGTVLFITHDRRLLANAATKLFILKEQQLISFEGPLSAHEETPGPQKHEHLEDELLQVETSIAEVLSRLSIKPAPELDEEFQSLLARKKALINQIEEN
jgi:pleuromutilin/lincosamide/streptogramin A transport system ATP-binding/permease protein